MPSVSNYDTLCGPGQMNFPGMRTDYELLVNSMKPVTNQSKHSFHAEQFSASGSNNTVNLVPNFHGSSNGYYGYHMITSADTSNVGVGADCKDECFMDTNDDFGNQGMTSHLNNDRLFDDARRKRPLATSSETLPKRSRQEFISDDFRQKGPPPPHNETRNISSFDEVRRSAVSRRSIIKQKSEGITLSRESSIGHRAGEVPIMKRGLVGGSQRNLELMENLLKETHGCDLYNYTVCDL